MIKPHNYLVRPMSSRHAMGTLFLKVQVESTGILFSALLTLLSSRLLLLLPVSGKKIFLLIFLLPGIKITCWYIKRSANFKKHKT